MPLATLGITLKKYPWLHHILQWWVALLLNITVHTTDQHLPYRAEYKYLQSGTNISELYIVGCICVAHQCQHIHARNILEWWDDDAL